MKKKCPKYQAWCARKGTFLTLVAYEINIDSVPRNTLWLESGATTNINVSKQGFLTTRGQMILKDTSMLEMESRWRWKLYDILDYYRVLDFICI